MWMILLCPHTMCSNTVDTQHHPHYLYKVGGTRSPTITLMENMMRYQPTVNLWNEQERSKVKTLQRGQWVSAGPVNEDRMNIGKFCGVTKSGTVVVAWIGNARNSDSYNGYINVSMQYAKGRD